jgi:hypothetical protein
MPSVLFNATEYGMMTMVPLTSSSNLTLLTKLSLLRTSKEVLRFSSSLVPSAGGAKEKSGMSLCLPLSSLVDYGYLHRCLYNPYRLLGYSYPQPLRHSTSQ